MREHGHHKTLFEIQHLRAIAVLMVVVAHIHQANGRFFDSPVLGQASLFGFAGVDVFFVLSGFIIHHLYKDHSGFDLRYFLNRLNRILPLYWIFTGLAVAGYFAMGSALSRPLEELDIFASITLIPTGQMPILQVGWTLTHELYFYLAYGLALLLPRPMRLWAALAWALASLAYILLPHGLNSPWLTLAFSPFNMLFLSGVALAALFPRIQRLRIPALILLVAGLALGLTWTHIHGLDGLAAAPLRVVILAPFAMGLVASFLAWTPPLGRAFATLGDWSYAIYLSHILVIGVLARLMPRFTGDGLAGGLALYAAGLVAALALGGLAHILVERPLLIQGKRLIARLASDRNRAG